MHIAVDVNGLLLGVVVTAASIQDRDAAHRLLVALRGSFSTIGLVWADGGYPGRLLIWAKDVLTLTMQIIKRIPGAAGFQAGPHLGGREKFRVDQQAPPLRARLRNQTRPPRSHGPPRHDHDHDQATRPNLTVFKHPLRGRRRDAIARRCSAAGLADTAPHRMELGGHDGPPAGHRHGSSLARGRGVGGGSAINGGCPPEVTAPATTRGRRRARETGASTAYCPTSSAARHLVDGNPALRGVDGRSTVGPARSAGDPVVAALLEAAAETSHRRATDIRAGAEEGFGRSDLNIVDGRRQSAADAYLNLCHAASQSRRW